MSIDNIVTPIVCLSTAFFGVRFGPKKVSETLGFWWGMSNFEFATTVGNYLSKVLETCLRLVSHKAFSLCQNNLLTGLKTGEAK